jgi:HAE1 family hydrophobic/amphiphilic exporter-1
MADLEMPRGYRWDKGARFIRMEETDSSQQFAIALSITFVFLLMGVLFESFVLPLSVIVSIPFAALGVYWTLYITGTPMDDLSRIGTVILVGVVVNNAIVLVDLVNRLRREGTERVQALVQAGRHRFRPILMTTFTTIFGLIPMAVGNPNVVGTDYAPLGRTMMGGLFASMVLTLLVVPLCYTFFDDLREVAGRAARRLGRRTERPIAGRVA